MPVPRYRNGWRDEWPFGSYFYSGYIANNNFDNLAAAGTYKAAVLPNSVATGFVSLDGMISGFSPADLIIIGGRPSMGKTSLCQNIACHAAIQAGIPVAIFSLDTAKEHLVTRMLCSVAEVDQYKMRADILSEADCSRLTRAGALLSKAPIIIDDTPSMSVSEIEAKVNNLKGVAGLVIIDYFQLLSRPAGTDIAELTKTIKSLASRLKVPVIVTCQVKRSVNYRRDKRPQISDLMSPAVIEPYADTIMLIYRDAVYNKDDDTNAGLAEIIVAKQRTGKTGTVVLKFDHERTAFKDIPE